MLESLKTIKKYTTYEINEKKSRFIASIFHINTKEEAEEYINVIKKENIGARHNVFAYRVLDNGNILERFTDDGEPVGTAGQPILNILIQKQLTNVLIVVTRYFGGILLGTGGLFKAYSDSAKGVIENSVIIENIRNYLVKISIEYKLLGKIEHYVKFNNYRIHKVEYLENINMYIYIPIKEYKIFESYIDELGNKNIDINILEEKYIEKV